LSVRCSATRDVLRLRSAYLREIAGSEELVFIAGYSHVVFSRCRDAAMSAPLRLWRFVIAVVRRRQNEKEVAPKRWKERAARDCLC
jgi:hypothetical protein